MQKRRAKIGVQVHVNSISNSVLFVSLGCKWSILTVTRCAGPLGTQCHTCWYWDTCLSQAQLRLSVQNFWISETAWKQKNLNIYPVHLPGAEVGSSPSWCEKVGGASLQLEERCMWWGRTLENTWGPFGVPRTIFPWWFQKQNLTWCLSAADISGHLTEQISVPPFQKGAKEGRNILLKVDSSKTSCMPAQQSLP